MNIFLRYAAETTNLPNHFRTVAYDARILYILSGRGELDYGGERAPLEPCGLCVSSAGRAVLSALCVGGADALRDAEF